MTVKTFKNIAVVACVSALALPAGVMAQGPSGSHGKSGDQHGNSHKNSSHTNKACKHTPRVGVNVKGTVAAINPDNTITVTVTSVSHHAKKYVTDSTITVPADAKRYDGIAVGDAVVVHGKIDKPKKKCNESDSDIASSLKYTRVTKDDSGTGTQDQQPQTDQPTS